MKITILGCGPSIGVPIIGCDCKVCTSTNPKNKRMRTSILLEQEGFYLLIDTAPDLRQQTMQFGLRRVDAVLYTHEHADHTHGIDDIRAFNRLQEARIPCYADARSMELIQSRFVYVFTELNPKYGWYKASMIPHVIEPFAPFNIGPFTITAFPQIHGLVSSLGFRIGNLAYSTDVSDMPEESFPVLEGVSHWIVDCQSDKPQFTHSHLEKTLGWIAQVRPKTATLIHMNHDLEYEQLSASLPAHIRPAYDGMMIALSPEGDIVLA